ncbi:hypothetical protein COLO4_20531 [Corchorus olitorius]|uniref:Uncharacterized protein n=1 Tax=Corchorus olitorius TaxID=93759 RepID=A0A1R3IZE0_9ROSI|nr:hypothetical protein COLO4_20531 [Corchorus olitorius]
MSADPLLNVVDKDLESAPTIEDDVEDENITVVKVTNEWTNFRDELAVKMFEEYRRRETHAAATQSILITLPSPAEYEKSTVMGKVQIQL